MEYQKNGDSAWTAVGSNQTEITGLTSGTYSVRYAGTADKNASPAATVEVGIKVEATVTKVPTAKTLTYTGQAQALVTAGEATGGTMQYALGTDATTAPADNLYTTSIPSKTDAGTYYVWYMAVGDEIYNETEPQYVTVTILGTISARVTFKVVNGSWDDGTTQDKTVDLTGTEGDTLKLMADQIPAVGKKPAEKYKEGSWDTVPGADTAITADTTYTYTYAAIEEGEKPSDGPGESEKPGSDITSPETPEDSTTSEKQAPASILLNSDFLVYWQGKKVCIKWGNVPKADRYVIYAAYCGKGKCSKKVKTVKGINQISLSKLDGKKLDQKKIVKVYVAAYQGSKKLGRTIQGHAAGPKSSRTNSKKLTLTKSTFKLKKGKTAKIKAKTIKQNTKKKLLGENHTSYYRYATTDKTVAKVDKNGKIKAVGKGKCYIWVYCQNGRGKRVKVIVK